MIFIFPKTITLSYRHIIFSDHINMLQENWECESLYFITSWIWKMKLYFKRFISPDISICMYAYRMVREALVKVSASRKVRWLEPRNSCVRLVILTEDLTVWGTYLKLLDDSSLQENVRQSLVKAEKSQTKTNGGQLRVL